MHHYYIQHLLTSVIMADGIRRIHCAHEKEIRDHHIDRQLAREVEEQNSEDSDYTETSTSSESSVEEVVQFYDNDYSSYRVSMGLQRQN